MTSTCGTSKGIRDEGAARLPPEAYQPFIESQLAINAFALLPILPRHTALLTQLPLHHRDPFDRLIVSQALAEAIPLVSTDQGLDAYGVERIW